MNEETIKQIREILTDPITLYTKWEWGIQQHVLIKGISDKRGWFQIREVAGFDKRAIKQITKELKKLGLKLISWGFYKRALEVFIEVLDK